MNWNIKKVNKVLVVTLLIDVSQNLNLIFVLLAFKHILLLDYNITMKEKSFNNGEGLLGNTQTRIYSTSLCVAENFKPFSITAVAQKLWEFNSQLLQCQHGTFSIAIWGRNKNSKDNGNAVAERSVVEVEYLFKERTWKSHRQVSMADQHGSQTEIQTEDPDWRAG